MLSTILYRDDAVMAMMPGTAYCFRSVPMGRTPSSVGAAALFIGQNLYFEDEGLVGGDDVPAAAGAVSVGRREDRDGLLALPVHQGEGALETADQGRRTAHGDVAVGAGDGGRLRLVAPAVTVDARVHGHFPDVGIEDGPVQQLAGVVDFHRNENKGIPRK